MKIAFIDSKLNLETGGGSNRSLHLISSKLISLGHHVMLITVCPTLNAYPEDLPYAVVTEGPLSNWPERKYGLTLRSILQKYEDEVDVYHLWDPGFLLDGAVYRAFGGKTPVVAYLNGYSFCTSLAHMNTECYRQCGLFLRVRHRSENLSRKMILLPFRALKHYLECLLLNQLDAFTPVSPAVAEIYSCQHLDQSKMFVIPPSIDYEHLRSLRRNRRHEPLSTGQYSILYVGRLTPQKGVDILMNAVSRLDFPASLHIVGDGRHRSELERLAWQLGLPDRVIFHGWMPFERVVDFYLSSQLFVHPARWPEPFGRTVLDAMALGLPVVAADSGGPPWALQGTGLTFRPGDSQDLAEKIDQMRSIPSLARTLAARAQERARDFDYTKTIPQLLEVCQRAIEAGRAE